MQPVPISSNVFHLQGGSNIGLLVEGERGFLIDAGLDQDTARRALRIVDQMGITLEAVFLTHAHADHFGGAHFLQQRLEVDLYAPTLEAAMMENPLIEPLYLFGGAAPIEELRHKFTLAPACRIDYTVDPLENGGRPQPLEIGPFQIEVIPLLGHALHQVGVAAGEVLFCADAVFPTETLGKHKVTFCVDMDETRATLERLPTLPYTHFAPGHGPVYTAGEEIASACSANWKRLTWVQEWVYAELKEPQETSTLVEQMCKELDLHLRTATAYFLTRAPVLAALSSLERAGKVKGRMEKNRLVWQQAQSV